MHIVCVLSIHVAPLLTLAQDREGIYI